MLIYIAYCKGSLTSLLYIDSYWVYLTLRSLTSLLYVIHVCKESLTSLLMHCILYFMWVRVLSPLLHVMQYARELTSRLSLHECISHIYLYCLLCFRPFFDELTKRGRRILRVYICMFIFLFMHICFVYAKKGEFGEFMHVYLLVYAYMFV